MIICMERMVHELWSREGRVMVGARVWVWARFWVRVRVRGKVRVRVSCSDKICRVCASKKTCIHYSRRLISGQFKCDYFTSCEACERKLSYSGVRSTRTTAFGNLLQEDSLPVNGQTSLTSE